ncbi:MAG: glycosyltransferase family 4 protein [Fibrobacterales bacterium]
MNTLLIVDSYSKYSSGGRVSHYVSSLLNDIGINVKVLTPEKAKTKDPNVYQIDENLNTKEKKKEYEKILVKDKIEVVHFLTYGNGKPLYYASLARKRKLKIIAHLWMHDFYCQKLYNYKTGSPCTKCSNNLIQSLLQGCVEVNIRGLKKIIQKTFFKNIFKKSDLFISPSDNISKLLTNYNVPKSKIQKIPLIFNSQRFNEFTYNKPKNYLLYFGSINDYKGAQFLVELAREFSDITVKVLPVGEKRFTENENLPPNIVVLENIRWDNTLHDEIKNAKAVIVPSKWDSTAEYALVESLALGKPVITFNVGIHSEVIDDGLNGFVVDMGDTGGVYERYVSLDDMDYHKKVSLNARKTFTQITNEDIYKSLLSSSYNKLIK